MSYRFRIILAIAMTLAYALGAISTCMIYTWLHEGENLVWVKPVDFYKSVNEMAR